MKTKNYIPILLFTFFCSTGFAQTQKGKFILSGKTDMNFLFSRIVTETDSIQISKTNSRQFNVTAGAGYFIANNLCLGIYGTYSYAYSKDQFYNSQSITESFTVLPQLQYYFPIESKLKPFAGVCAGYIWLQERDSRVTTDNNRVYSMSGPAFSGALGLSYFITRSVSLDLSFQ